MSEYDEEVGSEYVQDHQSYAAGHLAGELDGWTGNATELAGKSYHYLVGYRTGYARAVVLRNLDR